MSTEAIAPSCTPNSTLTRRLVDVAGALWNRPSVADSGGRSLTFGELLTQVRQLANWLRNRVLPEEQNIGILLPASVDAAIANFAVTLIGKTAVNLNFTTGERNCRAAVRQCDMRTVLSTRSFICRVGLAEWPEIVFLDDVEQQTPVSAGDNAKLDSIVESTAPDATACILFSSGSTGVPKGIELTHWNILSNAEGLAARIPPSQDDCLLGVLPFFHSFGYTFALWFPLLHGLRAVYHGDPTDAKVIAELAERHRATFFFSTPTLCAQYARKVKRDQFASLKYVIVGAEKLRNSVAEGFQSQFGISLLAGYGCTELGPGVAVNIPNADDQSVSGPGMRSGSVGKPLPGVSIRIVDPESMLPLATGQMGMVLVDGPSRMRGYFRAPELTFRVLLDGYYMTGDLGYLDNDGFLFITDRLARFSKVCGEMVPHLQIEEAVSELTPAFVTGIPDERRGERICMIYTNPDHSVSELHVRLNSCGLPALWIRKRESIRFVDKIPILTSGKVNLKEARTLAESLFPAVL